MCQKSSIIQNMMVDIGLVLGELIVSVENGSAVLGDILFFFEQGHGMITVINDRLTNKSVYKILKLQIN